MIIEPWESGTESSIDACIVKEKGDQFLIFVETNIRVREDNGHYFICELKNEEDKVALKNCVKGVYSINMVFDKNIINEQQILPNISSYRSNFLSGEITILNPLLE